MSVLLCRKNAEHQRIIAASLVQSVYVLERDREAKREGAQALAPAWWEFFQFKLNNQLIDEKDSSICGAIFELNLEASKRSLSVLMPRYVIAFRGTIRDGDAFL